jgi:hypothetical protein
MKCPALLSRVVVVSLAITRLLFVLVVAIAFSLLMFEGTIFLLTSAGRLFVTTLDFMVRFGSTRLLVSFLFLIGYDALLPNIKFGRMETFVVNEEILK